MKENHHISVLLDSIMNILGDISNKRILDCTFGAGGYSRRFLENGATVVAFDRDSNAIEIANQFKEKYGDKFYFIHDKFSNLDLAQKYFDKFDVIVFDFGLSSMQIDEENRGFSYQNPNVLLDMRMNQNDKYTASDFLNTLSEAELANIIKEYGDEPRAKQIAKKIILSRPLKTSGDLRKVIESVSFDKKSIAKVFQAIRIYLNDELNEIKTALDKTDELLISGGKLLTVSFHSGEDRIAKLYMQKQTTSLGNPKMPIPENAKAKYKKIINGHIDPSDIEINNNQRARSAHLRGIEKL